MKRRLCLGLLGAICAAASWAGPSAAEAARIDKLIAAVGKRTDISFVRNGKQYNCEQAAEFLRGKLNWRIEKVSTVQDFIDQIGTRSTTSGAVYYIKLADGRTMTSADFLRQELLRIDQR
jgi:hypothetical protein